VDLSTLDPRLLRLTYASRAVEWLAREDLRDIAASAQRRNRRLGLTGVLLYMNGEFLQVLEGPGPEVEQLFEMIENDPRNKWVTRLSTERVLRRAFGDWAMGCFELAPSALDRAAFIVSDADSDRLRPRFSGDFSVFLDQFYARNRTRGVTPDFAKAV
jgi:hypothetical protein